MVREIAGALPAAQAQKLAPFVPMESAAKAPRSTQAAWNLAQQHRKSVADKLERAMAKRVDLDRQVTESNLTLERLMEDDILAGKELEHATRALAAGVLKEEANHNVINISNLFKDSADELTLDFGDQIDFSGPAFSDDDRNQFAAFQKEQSSKVAALLHDALTKAYGRAPQAPQAWRRCSTCRLWGPT
eukprot:8608646-Pyramimonas_sp.AAC.1